MNDGRKQNKERIGTQSTKTGIESSKDSRISGSIIPWLAYTPPCLGVQRGNPSVEIHPTIMSDPKKVKGFGFVLSLETLAIPASKSAEMDQSSLLGMELQ